MSQENPPLAPVEPAEEFRSLTEAEVKAAVETFDPENASPARLAFAASTSSIGPQSHGEAATK